MSPSLSPSASAPVLPGSHSSPESPSPDQPDLSSSSESSDPGRRERSSQGGRSSMEATETAPSRRAAALPADQRRAAIIAAVVPLVFDHGDRVTTKQIADAAGVAEGTIFRVFVDKDELIAAAVEAALDPTPYEAAIAAIDGSLPLVAQLVAVVELLQRRSDGVMRLMPTLRPEMRERVRRPLSTSPALVEMLTGSADRLRITPAAAAQLIRALTLSMSHPMLAEVAAKPADIVDLLLHGVASEARQERNAR